MPRAIHGLDGIEPFVRCLGEIHVLAELCEMPGLLPECRVHQLRSTHLLVTCGPLTLAHISNECLKDGPALRVPEDGAWRFLLQMKEVELAPDAAMVALLSLFEPVQVG